MIASEFGNEATLIRIQQGNSAMKLTDLAIEGTRTGERFQLNRMHHGLNVVFDPSGGRRKEIVELIRYLFFGGEGQKYGLSGQSQTQVQGHADIARGPYRFRISRQKSHPHAMHVQGLDNASQIYSGDDLFGKVDLAVFNALYDVDFENPIQHLSAVVSVLTSKLGIGKAGRWASESEYSLWKREADAQKNRLARLRDESAGLDAERNRWARQVDSLALQELDKKQRADRELSELEHNLTLAVKVLESNRSELMALEVQIASAQQEIDRLANDVQYLPVERYLDSLQVLYGQLDLLAGQIHQWTSLRDQIQSQRVQLKNEIELWSELPLESADHPYHQCSRLLQRGRTVLEGLNQQFREFEQDTSRGRTGLAHHLQAPQLALSQLGSDLESVTSELLTLFRQWRHKSAAAVMKQLREDFNAINDNLEWLSAQFSETIAHLRTFDPSGASAIENPTHEFQRLSREKGFFAARESTLGAAPKINGDHLAAFPNLAPSRQRLTQLQLRRGELLESVAGQEARVHELIQHKSNFLPGHEGIGLTELATARERLRELQATIAMRNAEIETLQSLVADNDAAPPYMGSPILSQAGLFLSRLTDNHYQSVAIDANHLVVFTSCRPDQPCHANDLNPVEQKCALLAICLAANWWLNQQGLAVPMIFNDVFANLSSPQALAVASVLREFGLAGHQLIAFTNSNDIADWIAQRLIAGTFSVHKTPKAGTQVGTIPPITKDVLNHFVSRNERELSPSIPTVLSPNPSDLVTIPIQAVANPTRASDSDWNRQVSPLASLPNHKPTVYSDRSDFRTFPVYRPPLVAGLADFDRTSPESNINLRIRPQATRAVGPITESTQLQNVDLADSGQMLKLFHAGIHTIGDLLKLDPRDLSPDLETLGFSPEQFDRWQAQAWLLTCISSLSPSDSRVLVACGITEPEQLETTSPEQLSSKIQRYLASPDGRRFAPGDNRYQLERIQNWYRSLKESRPQWRLGNGYSRRMRRSGWRKAQADCPPAQALASVSELPVGGSYFSTTRTRDLRPGRGYFQPAIDAEQQATEYESGLGTDATPATVPSGELEAPSTGGSRFFLNPNDSVANAPSIGPRTAERFTNIGVQTIEDFLRLTAESMAEKINYKRLSAEVIRQWQHQSRLVCQVPNLRGHDAQLLVACGIVDPNQLKALSPKRLLDLVGPYSDTKEGLKIIRAGKKPDLAEVSDWIAWAKQTRSLQAA